MSNQNTSNQTVDTAIANTAIHDCDDSTYEVHVSAATQHMLAQLRENFITGLNIYSLIETTMLKYAESHATKDYLLVKSSQAYKQLSESTNKELVELRQLVEVLKKENEELRNELDTYRSKATVVEEPVTEDDVENAPILVSAPDIEHSSEHTVTLSDEDVKSIGGNGKVKSIKGTGFDTTPSIINNDFVDVAISDKQLESWANKDQYTSRPLMTFSDKDGGNIRENKTGLVKEPEEIIGSTVYGGDRSLLDHRHPNPNGAGNGVFVSTGKPDNGAEKIRVTEYSKVANTRI